MRFLKGYLYHVITEEYNFDCIGIYEKKEEMRYIFKVIIDNCNWVNEEFYLSDQDIKDFSIKKIGHKNQHPEYFL